MEYLECKCGGKIYDGMTWQGKKYSAAEWVLTHGIHCPFCLADDLWKEKKSKSKTRRK
jgi:hypothetical protein